jgi:hypothetical protein
MMTFEERMKVYIGPRRKRAGGGYYPRWPFRFKIPGQPWVHGTGAYTEASTRQLVDKLISERLLELSAESLKASTSKPSQNIPIERHVTDYLEWGRHQGGKGGLPWSKDHFKHRESQLKEWLCVLAPMTLDCIRYDDFATVNTEKLARGVAPNTVNHHAWALVSFVRWCHERGRVGANPLGRFTSLDRRPKRERGAFALAAIKHAFLARHGGVAGLSRVSHDLLLTRYLKGEEAKELNQAFREKRSPDASKFGH